MEAQGRSGGEGEVNKILAEQRRIRARACSAVKNGFIIRLENNYHPGRASRADFCGSGRCLHFDEMSGDRERERLERQRDAGNCGHSVHAFVAWVGLLLEHKGRGFGRGSCSFSKGHRARIVRDGETARCRFTPRMGLNCNSGSRLAPRCRNANGPMGL